MAHLIPMSPSDLPPQNYRLELPLPPRPAELVSSSFNQDAKDIEVPHRMPPSASLLGGFEWAWSPMNNAIVAIHLSLNRPGTRWLLWLGMFNDNDFPWHWDREILLTAPRGRARRPVVAIHLLEDALASLRDSMEYDRFHWITSIGLIPAYQIEAIGDLVWQ